jgi:hypothetical protein
MRPLAILALLLVVPFAAACGVLDRSADVAARGPQISDSAGVRVVTNAIPDTSAPTFRLAAEPRASIGVVEGAPEYTLSGAWGKVLSDGTIVLFDRGSIQLRFYDRSGKFLRSAGREGDGPGEFRRGTSLVGVLPGDSLVLEDVFAKRRVSIFTPSGDYARSIAVPDEVGLSLIVQGVLPDGRILIGSTPLTRMNHPAVVRDTVTEFWLSRATGRRSDGRHSPASKGTSWGRGSIRPPSCSAAVSG